MLHEVLEKKLRLLGILGAQVMLENVFERFEILAGAAVAIAITGAAGGDVFTGHFGGHAPFSSR